MGSCFSTGTTSDAVTAPPTAKVITIPGNLREYSTPAAAADVLGTDSAVCFLCSSDRLFCDEYIPALHPEELLQPGQIYFVLPATKLRYPLSGDDMAALAVKASSALGLLSGRGSSRRNKKIRIMPLPDVDGDTDGSEVNRLCEDKAISRRPPSLPAIAQRKMKRTASIKARVANRYYKYSRSRLSSIPELVE
ncbi:hypothetical protein Taro_025655 [Colocasia esculenta]|uniref:Uncharacterized protein n=1 Tax=Colocasia esculenta TaxID=4460 RepID=A0A843VAS4_COLES|nr:hypothetical protein [Colocasia esculenta]